MTKKEKQICIAWIKRTIELFGYDLEECFDYDCKWTDNKTINAIHKLLKELGKKQ